MANSVLRFVSREEWGGPRPKIDPPIPPIQGPVKVVVVTFETPSSMCYSHEECVKAMQQLYKYYVVDWGMPDIPFNFLVGNDGTIYEARGWEIESSRALRYFIEHHGRRLDIAFIGDYSVAFYPPVMSYAIHDLLGLGIEHGTVDRFFDILEHRDENKMLEAAAAEKKDKAWENWQIQDMAQKIFRKQMPFWEAQEKLKYVIPAENMPTNEFCVIM